MTELLFKQQIKLQGKGEFIDKYGRFKVNYHTFDKTKERLERINELLSGSGTSPVKHNGFYISIKSHTKMFAPAYTNDKNALLGCNLDMLCELKRFAFISKGEEISGWSIIPLEIRTI